MDADRAPVLRRGALGLAVGRRPARVAPALGGVMTPVDAVLRAPPEVPAQRELAAPARLDVDGRILLRGELWG